MTPYDQGQDLAQTVKEMRELDSPFDPRFDIADAAKVLSTEDFKEFMRGLNEGMAN